MKNEISEHTGNVSFEVDENGLPIGSIKKDTSPMKDEIDEFLKEILPLPYPDYNMGLLPDEEGYDTVQYLRNVNHEINMNEAKQAILTLKKKWQAEARIDENYRYIKNMASGDLLELQVIDKDDFQDRINQLNGDK